MKTLLAAMIASILTVLFVAACIFGDGPAVGFVGLAFAILWLWFERKATAGDIQRRRWKGTIAAVLTGIAAYGVFGAIASRSDVSGLVFFALLIGVIFILPGIFGIAGMAMRLLVRK